MLDHRCIKSAPRLMAKGKWRSADSSWSSVFPAPSKGGKDRRCRQSLNILPPYLLLSAVPLDTWKLCLLCRGPGGELTTIHKSVVLFKPYYRRSLLVLLYTVEAFELSIPMYIYTHIYMHIYIYDILKKCVYIRKSIIIHSFSGSHEWMSIIYKYQLMRVTRIEAK